MHFGGCLLGMSMKMEDWTKVSSTNTVGNRIRDCFIGRVRKGLCKHPRVGAQAHRY